MKLSNEQIKTLQKELITAKTPEEIAAIREKLEDDVTIEDFDQLLATAHNMRKELSEDVLENITGGIQTSDIPQYDVIKDYYKEKGANLAFILCIYYIPSPICYDIIQIIEEEAKLEMMAGGK